MRQRITIYIVHQRQRVDLGLSAQYIVIPLAQHLKESPCLVKLGLDTLSVRKPSDPKAGVRPRSDMHHRRPCSVGMRGMRNRVSSLTDDSGGPGNEVADRIRPHEALPLFA